MDHQFHMRALTRRILAAVLTATAMVSQARAETCLPLFFFEDVIEGPSLSGIDWYVAYTNEDWLDCGEEGHYFSTTWAQKIGPIIESQTSRQRDDWGFELPWADSLPYFGVAVFDSRDTGTNNESCITLDAKGMRCANDNTLRWVIGHEMFHAIQRRYEVNGGEDGSLGFGAWFTEGTARCLDDRYDTQLDSGGPFIVDTNRLMTANEIVDDEDTGPFRDKSLLDISYRACLFWSYCCEQLGFPQIEPDSGISFVRTLWTNVWEDIYEDDTKDALRTLRRTISEESGRGLYNFHQDFATCIYTREFDASGLPNAERYSFVDENPVGSSSNRYANMVRASTHDGMNGLPQIGAGIVLPLGHRYHEMMNPTGPGGTARCLAVGMRGWATDTVGWSLVGVTDPLSAGGPQRAVVLSKQAGKEYARAFLTTSDRPLVRLGAVVVGRGSWAPYGFTFDAGPVEPSIFRPTFVHPEYPGPHDAPGKFLLRAVIEGPDGLKPEGAGNLSIKGLEKSDFQVTVEGDDAPILSAGYVGGEYWLVCQAPEKPADGAYDVTLKLCPADPNGPSTTAANAVMYADITINHMLVIDTSGSMDLPSSGGNKMDAAKNAASLYLDAVNDRDRVGVVQFRGNNSECDDDSFLVIGLGDATDIHRAVAKSGVQALGPFGATSVGDGLWRAQDEFDNFNNPPLDETDLKVMVLLSDGQGNEARFWEGTIDCGGSDLGFSAKDRITQTDTILSTIAFGPESAQDVMQSMATLTGGDYSYVNVIDSARALRGGSTGMSMANELADTYLHKLEQARGLERLFWTGGAAAAGQATDLAIGVTEAGVDQGTFFVNWPAGAGNVVVELVDPNNVTITAAQAKIYTADTHVVYHLNDPLVPGTWRLSLTPQNETEFIAGLLGRQRFGVQLIAGVAQVNTGASVGVPMFGDFEQGVPVNLVATLTDSAGAVLGAEVSAKVIGPDGTTSCGQILLMDDGEHDDGEANDGIYAAIFTNTAKAGTKNGVYNDDPSNPNPGGANGSYRVDVTAAGTGNLGQPFLRMDRADFHVYVANRNDEDEDGLPDTWEKYYGTNLNVNDASEDPDGEGLRNIEEFINGTDPFDSDTDDGGETDFSEISHGRCPLDPQDDLLPAPIDVQAVVDTGDMNEDILLPNAMLLTFPVYPSYLRMRIMRADETDPGNFVEVALVDVKGPGDGRYYDMNLVDGRMYYYMFQAVGASNAVSAFSRVVQGRAHKNPIPPMGWVDVNNGAERTDSANVLVTLNLSTTADKYRLANGPITGLEPLLPIPATPYVNWTLALPAPGGLAEVHVEYVDTAAGTSHISRMTSIIYDPNGDFDGDGAINAIDTDDDGDGLKDTDEVFVHHTDAFKMDSDEDGLTDGFEVGQSCTHPRNPDTDGDDLLDGVDYSPAGDIDADGDTDLEDYKIFQICYTGSGGGPFLAGCACLDVDDDGDIDLADYGLFNAAISGPQ